MDVFREVKRILRDDGVLYLNLGDSYHNKQKQGMPHRVVLALQNDGWIWRDEVVWFKTNAMPCSVTDRTTPAHEFIYMLTKKKKYYYDKDAIAEPCVESNASRPRMGQGPNTQYAQKRRDKGNAKTFRGGGVYTKGQSFNNSSSAERESHGNEPNESGTRNKRSVWVVPTKAYSSAHFATFSPDLIRPCILAGCPKEVCVKCGEPRVRIVKSEQIKRERKTDTTQPCDDRSPSANNVAWVSNTTTGWTDCGCGEGFRPGITLDPFMGAFTTALVAYRNNRDYVGCELSPEYLKLGEARMATEKDKYSLFESNTCIGIC